MGAEWQLFTFRLDLHGTECPLVQSVTAFIVSSELSGDHLLMRVSHHPDPGPAAARPRTSTSDIYVDTPLTLDTGLMTFNYILYLTYPWSHSLQCPSFYSFPQTIIIMYIPNINVQCYLCLKSSMSPFHLTHPPYSNWGWFASFSSKLTEASLYPAYTSNIIWIEVKVLDPEWPCCIQPRTMAFVCNTPL